MTDTLRDRLGAPMESAILDWRAEAARISAELPSGTPQIRRDVLRECADKLEAALAAQSAPAVMGEGGAQNICNNGLFTRVLTNCTLADGHEGDCRHECGRTAAAESREEPAMRRKVDFKVGDIVMLFADVGHDLGDGNYALKTDGGNHIKESARDMYEIERIDASRQPGEFKK